LYYFKVLGEIKYGGQNATYMFSVNFNNSCSNLVLTQIETIKTS